MALNLADRVRETTNVVGTGPATLLGAVAGYQAFSVVGDANTCYYTIADQQGVNWEVGIGTYSSTGPTLTRTTILSSSNAGSVVDFTFGTKDIFLTYPSEKAVYLDGSGNVQPNLGAASFTSITDSGNLTFTGTGNRITGDFSNATASSRVAFQTSTTNGATTLTVLPNGTSTTSTIQAYNNSDPTNASLFTLISTSADSRLNSTITGTGTYLPLTMYTGGSERLRIDTSGNVGIGTSSPNALLNTYAATNSLSIQQVVQNANGGSGVAALGFDVSFVPTEGRNIKAGIGLERGQAYGGGALCFYNNISGTAGNFTTADEKMRINNSGNVGIGTSSPLGKLQVSGTTPALTTGYSQLNIFSTDALAANVGGRISLGGVSGNVSSFDPYGFVAIAGLKENATASNFAGYFTVSTSNSGGSVVERMRIDSSGNVGIGTTAPGARLQIEGGTSADQFRIGVIASDQYFKIGRRNTDGLLSFAGQQQSFSGYDFQVFPSGGSINTSALYISGATGNVGIGTSSAGYPLDVGKTVSSINARFTDGTRNILIGNDANEPFFGTGTNNALRILTNNTERMRITSDGEVYIAGTTDRGAYNLQCNGTGVWGAGAYVNGSDARIKEDVAPIDSGLDVVAKLNPVTYRYKEDWTKDQSTQTGFIAQELLVALEGKNYVDGVVQQGGEYMSVAYQNLIPVLTKAIQEQQTLIENLTTRLNALEGN